MPRGDDAWYEMQPEDYAKLDADREARFRRGVLENPGGKELGELFRRMRSPEDGLRGVIHGGSIFWWDSDWGTHTDGDRWLGVPPAPAGTPVSRMRDDEIELHRGEDGRLWIVARSDEALARAMEHPSLAGGFDADGAIHGVLVEPPEPARPLLMDEPVRKSKKKKKP